MMDKTLERILRILHEIGRESPARAVYVCAYMLDYMQTIQSVSDRFRGSRMQCSRANVARHLLIASAQHPELRMLLKSTLRKTHIRIAAQKKRKAVITEVRS